MQEVRCASCNRKLAVGVFQQLDIKCPRCGVINSLRVENSIAERRERLLLKCLKDSK
ncbi:Com family DNA-binding transcriptional regulator [Delftia acidovorans]|uniref:Com family DNA-binding transcriptional regulator n=1 Tax=Delftia acidovorans TaxID=80866 RepID=UPI0028A6F392|nr:Com family DNA-binding transcriptional regulator [Delftia acidovorans]